MSSLACQECAWGCPDEAELRRHLCTVHLAYRRFRCPLCAAKPFPLRQDLLAHFETAGHPFFTGIVEEPSLAKEQRLNVCVQASFDAARNFLRRSTRPCATASAPVVPLPAKRRQPSTGPSSKRPRTGSFCVECQVSVNSPGQHVIVHAPAELRAITCLVCPPRRPFQVKWWPSNLRAHYIRDHPGRTRRFTDDRPHYADLIAQLRARCFGAAERPDSRASFGEETELDVDGLDEKNISLELPPEDQIQLSLEESRLEVPHSDTESEDGAAAPPPEDEEDDEPKPAVTADDADRANFCLECRETFKSPADHVVSHAPSDLRAITCLNCPTEAPVRVKWWPSNLRKHYARAHPGEPRRMADTRRCYRKMIRELLGQYFGHTYASIVMPPPPSVLPAPPPPPRIFVRRMPPKPVPPVPAAAKLKTELLAIKAEPGVVEPEQLASLYPEEEAEEDDRSEGELPDSDGEERLSTPPSSRRRRSTAAACRKCGVRTDGRASHVVSRHLHRLALTCRRCPFATHWSAVAMRTHVEAAHPEAADSARPAFKDRREKPKYRRHFAKQFRKCWGDA